MNCTERTPAAAGKRLDELAESLTNLEDKISRAPQQVKLSFYRELDGLKTRFEKLREHTMNAEQGRSSAAAKTVQQELAGFESALKDAYLRFTDKNLTEDSDDTP